MLEEIRKSKYFKMTKNDTPFALSDEDRKKYWDLTVFLTAFKTNIQAMSSHANTLGHYYLRHPGVSDESVRETVLTFDEAIDKLELNRNKYYTIKAKAIKSLNIILNQYEIVRE